LDAIPNDKIVLAKLQSIKTPHWSCIEIPRSLERQYLPGASLSVDDASASALSLILPLNHHASCLLCERKRFAGIDGII
jgi:hypothetical protein